MSIVLCYCMIDMKQHYNPEFESGVSKTRELVTSAGLLIGYCGMLFWGAAIAVDGGSEPAVDGATALEVNETYDWGSDFERENFFTAFVIAAASTASAVNAYGKESQSSTAYQPQHLR